MSNLEWLEELYRQHRRVLFHSAWNILRCSSLAEDAVHSAFVRLAQSTALPREPKLYALRAVRNEAIDMVRRRGRLSEIETTPEVIPAISTTTPDDRELHVLVEEALGKLSAAEREIIELHTHSELTFQEIAALRDEPLPTVASRYRRGLEKLKTSIEAPYEQ